MDFITELKRNINDANRAATEHIAIGREQGKREAIPLYAEIDRLRAKLSHIVAMADKYPEALLPTPLLAAIEAGRQKQ